MQSKSYFHDFAFDEGAEIDGKENKFPLISHFFFFWFRRITHSRTHAHSHYLSSAIWWSSRYSWRYNACACIWQNNQNHSKHLFQNAKKKRGEDEKKDKCLWWIFISERLRKRTSYARNTLNRYLISLRSLKIHCSIYACAIIFLINISWISSKYTYPICVQLYTVQQAHERTSPEKPESNNT